ncbi:hypothetical protein [Streptomyces sp. CA-106131]|uniref:hypothetical protein n=1 Tax=Streptomyces sp. CA-106131 TaxID=3240045 RepID=UPI003D89CB54
MQRAKLDRAGLAALFDGVAISEGIGARKPERALFEAAAAACGVPLSGVFEVRRGCDVRRCSCLSRSVSDWLSGPLDARRPWPSIMTVLYAA